MNRYFVFKVAKLTICIYENEFMKLLQMDEELFKTVVKRGKSENRYTQNEKREERPKKPWEE
jgi:hypothetical protein